MIGFGYFTYAPIELLAALGYFVAGIFDSVCGGGGLLTIPMLMATGLPIHMVSGTNHACCLPGVATSSIKFIRSGNVYGKLALVSTPAAFLGACLGSRLNLLVPDRYLELLILVLMPVVAVIVFFKKDFGSSNEFENRPFAHTACVAAAASFLVSAYHGFYGPGSGTFAILAFAILLKMDLVHAVSNARVMITFAVLGANVAFLFNSMVDIHLAIPCGLCCIAGNWLGTNLAVTKGAKVFRPMFFVIMILLFSKTLTSILGI